VSRESLQESRLGEGNPGYGSSFVVLNYDCCVFYLYIV